MNQVEMLKLEIRLSEVTLDYWLHHDLFTWRWWILLGFSIFPSAIWWKILDKTRKPEILLYGFCTAFLATFLDVLGWNLNLWSYPHKLLPLSIPLIPADLIILPIFYMLVYQRFLTWRSFFWANIALAFILAFIMEPLFLWIEISKFLAWKHVFSFPIYIAISILGKWVTMKIMK
ncbi:CBO0543 family protein [Ammoniphilus sp. 3BR4]|uniref:CBO0543 family protein n=1 Tax=Ammoniphilus sp. 3BR4 TaxID=3158265 RepID=UPI0034663E18